MLAGIVGAAALLVLTAAALTILIPLAKKRAIRKGEEEIAALATQISDKVEDLASTGGLAYRVDHRQIDLERAEIGHAHAENLIRELVLMLGLDLPRVEQKVENLIAKGDVVGNPDQPDSLRPSSEGLTATDPEYQLATEMHLREYEELHRAMSNPRLHLHSVLTEAGLRERAKQEEKLAEPVPDHSDFHKDALHGMDPKFADLLAAIQKGDGTNLVQEILKAAPIAFPELSEKSKHPRSGRNPQRNEPGKHRTRKSVRS